MTIKSQKGFTLYELLSTMLVVGVVLSLGVPNMQSFRQNSRMTAAANDLHSSCASVESSLPTLTPVCSGGFEAGWVVFEDRDADLVVDAGEPILRRYPAMNTDIAIKTVGSGPDDYFMYASTGLGRRDSDNTVPVSVMVMCDPRGNVTGGGGKSTARVLIVTPLGRAAVLGDIAEVRDQGGCL